MDVERHKKLCETVCGIIPADGYREILEFPKTYNNQPAPEEFKKLLERIQSKLIAPAAKFDPLSADPNNEKLDLFLKNEKVFKLWRKMELSATKDTETFLNSDETTTNTSTETVKVGAVLAKKSKKTSLKTSDTLSVLSRKRGRPKQKWCN